MITDHYLTGRHAVVTGGGRGVGADIAAALAARGADVTLMGRTLADLETHASVLAETHGVGTAAVMCDVADEGSVREAFNRARAVFGDPHVLVNNAGYAKGAPLHETSLAMWQRTLAVNLTGAFLCTREVLPAMIAATDGRIVNLASTAAVRGHGRVAAYTASKHGLLGLTRSLAAETAKLGITVNAVCPSYIEGTDMTASAVEAVATGTGRSPGDARAMLTRVIARGSLIRPDEVAATVVWLCSPAASGISGQAIVVAGGEA